jgi:hypothetical protein
MPAQEGCQSQPHKWIKVAPGVECNPIYLIERLRQNGNLPNEPMQDLCRIMAMQVEAINRLAASNEALVQAMAEGDQGEEQPSGTYMDGSKAR